MTPPPLLGEAPASASADTTVDRAFLRYAGGAPASAQAPNELMGIPGSRGTIRGPARVVATLEDAGALRPGEILVAPTTLPTWTPLFATAAALVTETGGPLSHSAIVAREYAIPAVVGALGATDIICTGAIDHRRWNPRRGHARMRERAMADGETRFTPVRELLDRMVALEGVPGAALAVAVDGNGLRAVRGRGGPRSSGERGDAVGSGLDREGLYRRDGHGTGRAGGADLLAAGGGRLARMHRRRAGADHPAPLADPHLRVGR